MSAPFRAKSPSTSSGNSDSLDGPSPKGGKSGSFGNRFNSPKGSPGGKFKLKFKGAKSGRSNSDLSPQLSKGDRRDLSPQLSKGDRHDLSPLPDGRSSPGLHETSPQPSEPQIPKVPSSENFFTFTATEDVNIWEDENFTTILKKNTLRKQSLLSQASLEATPLQEDDDTVENIGVAYLEPDRSPRLPKRDTPDSNKRRMTSPAPTVNHSTKTKGKSSSVSVLVSSPASSLPVGSMRPRVQTDAAILTGPSRRPFSPESGSDKINQLELEIKALKLAQWKPPALHDTIDRMLVGKSYCLEWYKSPIEKRALLDAAIATHDGNCITAILLFIRKTVNQPIFLGMLAKRPVAVRHYANFLRQLGAQKELNNLYMRMNDYESLGNLKLQQCEIELDPGERYSKIRSCHLMFKSTPQLQADAQHVEDYARLTDKQKKIEESIGHGEAVVLRPGSVLFRSIVTTLLYCCRYHRQEQESNTANPIAFRKLFNIPEKQYFQMYLLALCIDEDWEGIEALVTTKGFMGMAKKKKSPIGFERVVKTLAKQNIKAPNAVLTKYLTEIDDIELRLQLATEVQVFDVALECLKLLRDKERLRGYINYIPSNKHWEFRKKIEALLSNSQIRWK